MAGPLVWTYRDPDGAWARAELEQMPPAGSDVKLAARPRWGRQLALHESAPRAAVVTRGWWFGVQIARVERSPAEVARLENLHGRPHRRTEYLRIDPGEIYHPSLKSLKQTICADQRWRTH